MNEKIYESLKIEVEGGQYVKAEMVAKIDYAFFTVGKISQEHHTELLELIEECADPNYKPVKTLTDRVVALEVESLNNMLCIADLSEILFEVDDTVLVVLGEIEGLEARVQELEQQIGGIE